MHALFVFLAFVLLVAATPFLIAYIVVRATEKEAALVGPASEKAHLPVMLRLFFSLVGILMSILSVKLGYVLVKDGATAYEVFNLAILALASVFAMSFALPLQHLATVVVSVTVAFSVLTMSTYLWRFGGFWRWGIVVLVASLPFLIYMAIRKNHKPRNSSTSADGLDTGEFDSYSVSNGGDCGGGGD